MYSNYDAWKLANPYDDDGSEPEPEPEPEPAPVSWTPDEEFSGPEEAAWLAAHFRGPALGLPEDELGFSPEREAMEDELGAQAGDPRRCPRHPGEVTSSPDGLHDFPCPACEHGMALEAEAEAADGAAEPEVAVGFRHDDYWTLVLDYQPLALSVWYPTEPTGPFATLTRGAFATEELAHAWAAKHLRGGPYTTKHVELATADDNDDICF